MAEEEGVSSCGQLDLVEQEAAVPVRLVQVDETSRCEHHSRVDGRTVAVMVADGRWSTVDMNAADPALTDRVLTDRYC
jgi:hypothetical protein